MTDPIFKRTASELLGTFQADAVVVVSWNRWGVPSVAWAEKVGLDQNDAWAVGNYAAAIQALAPHLKGE